MFSFFSSRPIVHVYAVKETIAQAPDNIRDVYQTLKKSLDSGKPFISPLSKTNYLSVFISFKDGHLYDDTTKQKDFRYKEISEKKFKQLFPNPSDCISVNISDFEHTTQLTRNVAEGSLRSPATSPLKRKTTRSTSTARALSASLAATAAEKRQGEQRKILIEQSFSLGVKHLDDTLSKLKAYDKRPLFVRFFSFGQPGRLIKELKHHADAVVKQVHSSQQLGGHYTIDGYNKASIVLKEAQVALETHGQTSDLDLHAIINVRIILLKELIKHFNTFSQKKDISAKKIAHIQLLLGLNDELIRINASQAKTIAKQLKLAKKTPIKETEQKRQDRELRQADLQQQRVLQASNLVPLYITQIQLIKESLTLKDSKTLKNYLNGLKVELESASKFLTKDHKKQTDAYTKRSEAYQERSRQYKQATLEGTSQGDLKLMRQELQAESQHLDVIHQQLTTKGKSLATLANSITRCLK